MPLVNGDGQTPWPSEGQLDEIAPDGSSATVSHPSYRPGVTATRRLAVEGGEFIDEVGVTTGSDTPQAIGVVLNTPCAVTADSPSIVEGASLPTATAFHYWKDWTAYAAPGTWSGTLDCGGRQFALDVSGPAMQRVYVGTVPDSAQPYTRRGIYVEGIASVAQFYLAFRPL